MSDQRPNIVFIITDQQRFDTINALGFPYMDTPHLDRMVNEGVSFNNCHITAPSCAPAPRQPIHGLLSACDGHPEKC